MTERCGAPLLGLAKSILILVLPIRIRQSHGQLIGMLMIYTDTKRTEEGDILTVVFLGDAGLFM